ncbi:PhoH family protein, partial [Enterococcus lactis]|nr:PhoH family protein [Enterococcus lactis]
MSRLIIQTANPKKTDVKGYLQALSDKLIKSKNLILRGAPGTGKTFLANEMAADVVS